MELKFLAGVITEDKLYFSSWQSNGLFMHDLACEKCRLIDVFANEDEEYCLHNKAILYKNEIWFIPNRAYQIAYYNLEQKKLAYLPLPQEGKEILDGNFNKTFKFNCLYENGSGICWLVPVGYNLFLRVDFENRTVRKIDSWNDLVKSEDGKVNFYTGFLGKNVITFCPFNCQKELVFDTRSEELAVSELNTVYSMYRQLIKYNDIKLYIPVDLREDILICNEKNDVMKKINIHGDSPIPKLCIVSTVRGSFLYLFPFNYCQITKINLDAQEVAAEITLGDYSEGCFIQNVLIYNDILYASSDRINHVICLDKNDICKIIQNVISEQNYYKDAFSLCVLKDYSDYFKSGKRPLDKYPIMRESDIDDLRILINGCNGFIRNGTECKSDIGAKIYLSVLTG